jgi:hypothetical protein
VQFPRLLGGHITLLGYPIPMVLAEKIVTASQRGITSTRWRDYADLYLIAGQHPLVAGDVRAAINEVAAYRNAEMGSLRPALDVRPTSHPLSRGIDNRETLAADRGEEASGSPGTTASRAPSLADGSPLLKIPSRADRVPASAPLVLSGCNLT